MAPSTLTFRGRLPGVDCSSALPAGDQPVRLDVAGFVGFAEKGPLDLPVAIEDAGQYAAVFGADLALAQESGVPVYAQLPSAVRAFFDNGGRRCHVVRVAGDAAVPARWAVPGLQVWQGDGNVSPAVVESAWAGAWSAGTSVSAVLVAQQLAVSGPYVRAVAGAADGRGLLPLAPGATVSIQSGDLLRLDLGPLQPGLFARVHSTDPRTCVVRVDAELAVIPGTDDVSGTPIPDAPDPGGLAGLPAQVAVHAVQLLRIDLVVRQRVAGEARVLERLVDLALGTPAVAAKVRRPAWTDLLQPAGPRAPDLDRSMNLRQDPQTMADLATGLVVPVGMPQPGSPDSPAAGAADTDPSGAPGLLEAGDDDLSTLDLHGAFLDPQLAGDTTFSLLAHASQLTVLARNPLRLKGIHALTDLDEVALVVAPDATQRGWSPVPPPPPPALPPPHPDPLPVDWSTFLCCDTEPEPVTVPEPEPAPDPISGLPELDRLADFDEGALLDVQVGIVVLCAARADQVGLLSVPRHYDTAATLAWHERITTDGRTADAIASGSPPLSHAAYWHPWVSVVGSQTGQLVSLRDIPPDGPVAGMVAARELARGAWIAPAGVPLRGVVRLGQGLSDHDAAQLFDAHANLVTHLPGAFTTLSAHTLTGDPQLLQLSVRRLVILLRRIALRLGARYTFEVNNDRFRQLVRMRFDRLLSALTARGALHAFRVLTDGGINTTEDQDNGRFVVALQIAPTSPIEFITVTLVRSGEGLLDVLEG